MDLIKSGSYIDIFYAKTCATTKIRTVAGYHVVLATLLFNGCFNLWHENETISKHIKILIIAWQNQHNDLWACEDRSAWASAQSNQILRCPHEETLGRWLPTEHTAKTDQTGWMPRLIFPRCTGHFVGFIMLWLTLGPHLIQSIKLTIFILLLNSNKRD